MIKVQLIDDAHKAFGYISTLCMSASAAIIASLLLVPKDYVTLIPKEWILALVFATLILGIIGRFFKAISVTAPQEDLVPSMPVQAQAAPPVVTPPVEVPVAVVTKTVPAPVATAPADPASSFKEL